MAEAGASVAAILSTDVVVEGAKNPDGTAVKGLRGRSTASHYVVRGNEDKGLLIAAKKGHRL